MSASSCASAYGMWMLAAAVLLASPAHAHQADDSRWAIKDESLEPSIPYCRHHSCRYTKNKVAYYEVEGKTIEMGILFNTFLDMDCGGASVLESPALPRFEPAQSVNRIDLYNCPLPAVLSIREAFAAVNLSICKNVSKYCDVYLIDTPITPLLSAKHFRGLEHISDMRIQNKNMHMDVEHGFLKMFKRLRNLFTKRVTLSVSDLQELSPSIEVLSMNIDIQQLPKAIHSSTNVTFLIITSSIPFDMGAMPPQLGYLELDSPATTTLRLDAVPATLYTLRLSHWVEPLPPPVARCDALQSVTLLAPAMRALPDGWLANCSRLKALKIDGARNLTTLPQKLFSPISHRLVELILRQGALETLPEGLLNNITTLKKVVLDGNRLKSIPRLFKISPSNNLLALNLASNDLDNEVFHYLGGALDVNDNSIDLDLSHNPRINNMCEYGDGLYALIFSCFKKIFLSNTGVHQICQHWLFKKRVEMLDLSNTSISQLSYEDLQYQRDVRAQVLMRGAPITKVRVTREQYNEAKRAQPSFTTVEMDAEIKCDCNMYWARLGLDHYRAQYALPGIGGLRCVGGGLVGERSPEDMVCGAQEECAAGSLPAGCECVARPDDSSTEQDRWLVRVRCENSPQRLVPRRLYPYYPLHRLNSQGAYLTQRTTYLNRLIVT